MAKNGKTKKWRLEDEKSILQEQWPKKYYLLIIEAELQTNWKSTIGRLLKLKFSSTFFLRYLIIFFYLLIYSPTKYFPNMFYSLRTSPCSVSDLSSHETLLLMEISQKVKFNTIRLNCMAA
jgi:hypothetical protein